MEVLARAKEAFGQFEIENRLLSIEPYGSGHINDTFLVKNQEGSGIRRYILQRINHTIFTRSEELMENISMVTAHLRKKIVENGGDPNRETLNIIPSAGEPYYKNTAGEYFRLYYFIERGKTYDMVRGIEDFYESAAAFGRFQSMLADFPVSRLHESISGFHDTPARLAALRQKITEDRCNRADGVQAEIDFALSRSSLAKELMQQLAAGVLPLRVTHNDTKLNNVMLDEESGKGLCVIDLDTVMPGLAVNDFGDSIRFGANTGAEDERELERVSCNLELFTAYTEGFISGCQGRLTKAELKALPLGARTMTYECGIHFLADYLDGDNYFKIHREDHNLDRCRSQFKLLEDMEAKQDEMERIVAGFITE